MNIEQVIMITEINKMIPCKTNKCLKYPACRNKTSITCENLINYFRYKEIRHTTERAWTKLHKHLPNVKRLNIESHKEELVGNDWLTKAVGRL